MIVLIFQAFIFLSGTPAYLPTYLPIINLRWVYLFVSVILLCAQTQKSFKGKQRDKVREGENVCSSSRRRTRTLQKACSGGS